MSNEKNDTNEKVESTPDNVRLACYVKPELIVYGQMEELTRGTASGGGDAGVAKTWAHGTGDRRK